jgi:hypothetical protein
MDLQTPEFLAKPQSPERLLRRYGLGPVGSTETPLFGRGPVGKTETPLLGRGPVGKTLTPLFFEENASLAYEIAMFTNAANRMVTNTARNLFSVTLDLILTSLCGNDERSSVTTPVNSRSLNYANLKLMSSIFFLIRKNWRNITEFEDFSTEDFSHMVHIFEKTHDFA